jgi:hypothetical protein
MKLYTQGKKDTTYAVVVGPVPGTGTPVPVPAGTTGTTVVGGAGGAWVGVRVMVDRLVVGTQVVTVMTETEGAGGETTG